MSLLAEYTTNIRPRIDATVQETLATTIKDGLCKAIERSAKENVYDAYTPSPERMAERRYELGDRENLIVLVGENSIEIKNVERLRDEPLQGEAVVVEEGMESYNQPFPREFMEPALQEYLPFARNDLAYALRSVGFDIVDAYDPDADELPF